MRARRSAPVVVAVLALAGLVAVPVVDGAWAAPAPTVWFLDDPSLPQQVQVDTDPSDGVDGDDDEAELVGVYLESSTPVDVHLTLSSPDGDVEVERAEYDVSVDDRRAGSTGPYDGFALVKVEVTTPGFHPLTYTAQVDGGDTVTYTQPYLWGAGGPPLAGHDTLAGRTFRTTGEADDYDDCEGCSYRYLREVTFVDAHEATFGVPRRLATACDRPHRCVPYEYDRASGLVQVGDGIVGSITVDHDYLDNATPGDPQDDDQFGESYFRAYSYDPGLRSQHVWHSRSAPRGSIRLATTRDGRCTLRVAFTDRRHGYVRRYVGRCRVGPDGLLTVHAARGRRVLVRATFVAGALPRGTPDPGRYGVLLVLDEHVRHGRHVDVVHLDEALRPV